MSEHDEQEGGVPPSEALGQDTNSTTDDGEKGQREDKGNREGDGKTQEGMAGQGTGQIK